MSAEEQATLVIVKPHAYKRKDEIVARMMMSGFSIPAGKRYVFDLDKAREHYAEHEGKPFFSEIVGMITEGPSYVMVVYGPSAVGRVGDMAGDTDPSKAAKGTIRRKYGIDKCRNAVHRSDSHESARKEILMHFSPSEIPDYVKRVIDAYPVA